MVADVPFGNTQQQKDTNWSDDFASDKNLAFWEWDVNIPKPQATVGDGELVVSTSHDGISFLGLRPRAGDYSLTAEVILSDSPSGIGVYSNQENVLAFTANASELTVFKIEKGEREILGKEAIDSDRSVFLKYEAVDGRYYRSL